MKVLPRVLYLLCFIGVAAAAAFAFNRALDPSMSTDLLRAVIMASLCGAAGLVHRKAWAVSLLLLPLGAYLLLRVTLPPDADVEGMGAMYRFYVDQLASGADQYATKYFPIDLAGAAQLQLLLAFVVYCLVGAASFITLSLRKPVPGIALLLVLLGFGFTVDGFPRLAGTAIAAFVLAACLLVFSRILQRRTWRLRDAVPGVVLAAAGSLLAVGLLGAAPSSASTPWQDWRTWDPFNRGGGRSYSFNWLQNYPELLDPAKNMLIMNVESPRPSYWRANALDSFTGKAWVSTQSFLEDVPRVPEGTGYTYSVPPSDIPPRGESVIQRFQVRYVYTNYFFTGGDPSLLTFADDVTVRMNDMRALHVVSALGPSIDYSVTAVIPKITPADLVGLGTEYPDSLSRYLELPFPRADEFEGADAETRWRETVAESASDGWQWTDLYSLNKTVVGDAEDPYEIALRLERYLRQEYNYTLEPPRSDYASPYAAFLFDTRAGYCQHFAGVMAMFLRYNGVPSRVAVGFATGDLKSPGVYSVATGNAHAWVEAYFPTIGWVSFDPTPGRSLPNAGASSTSPGFIDPFASTDPSTQPSDTTTTTDLRSGGTGGFDPAEQSGPGWISRVPWLPWVLGILVLLAAWPFGRRLWRERNLRRGPLDNRFAAAVRLLRRTLPTYGLSAPASLTLEEVFDLIETHVGLRRDDLFAARAGAILFGGRHARTDDIERAEAFRREVEGRLRRRQGRVNTVLAWYGLPQIRRMRTRLQASPAPRVGLNA